MMSKKSNINVINKINRINKNDKIALNTFKIYITKYHTYIVICLKDTFG